MTFRQEHQKIISQLSRSLKLTCGREKMGKAKSRKLRDLMRKVEYEHQQQLEEKNQATIDFIKTYSTIARKTEDYQVIEKVLDLKNIPSIDPINYPNGLVLPDSWAFEFGLK